MTSKSLSLPVAILSLAMLILVGSCALITKTLETGGERQFKPVPPPPAPSQVHVLIFAMDGAVPDVLMDAVHSPHMPFVSALFGKDLGNGVFEHAYAAPHALSVLPSSTIADWTAIFTGSVPAEDGIPGDEWFNRGTKQLCVAAFSASWRDHLYHGLAGLVSRSLQPPDSRRVEG